MASLKKLNDDFDDGKLTKNTFSSELNNDFVISSDNSKSNGNFVDLDEKFLKEGAGSGGGEESTILIKITTTAPAVAANIDLMQASNHVDKTKNDVEPEAATEVVNKNVESLEAEVFIKNDFDANSKKSSKKDISSGIEIKRNGNFYLILFSFFFLLETFFFYIQFLPVCEYYF